MTHFGRLVVIGVCIWGVFLLSLFVVTLNNNTTLTQEENKVFDDIVMQDNIKSELCEDAARFIQLFYHFRQSRRERLPLTERFIRKIDAFTILNTFRRKRKYLNKRDSVTNVIG